ncbi:MAG: hypothetical protein IPQ13_13805 [Holophagaceae bacterium]|nr:hypothetical protein [Holophagaceae bacterium]
MNLVLWLLALTLTAPFAAFLGMAGCIIFTGNRLVGMAVGIPLGFIANWCVFPYKFWRPLGLKKYLFIALAFIVTYLIAVIFESLNLRPFHDSYNEKNLLFSLSFGPPLSFWLISRFLIKMSPLPAGS